MKLKIATEQYRSKNSAELIAAVDGAINGLRPEWEKLMTAILGALIEDFGSEIAEDLGAETPKTALTHRSEAERSVAEGAPSGDGHKWAFDPVSAAARAWIIKNGAASVKSILTTDLDDVKLVILAGVDENLTTPQIARNIRQFYTDQSAGKAMRVARTEVSHAAGFGQREAARQSGIVKTHTWITSRDDRVRDAHIAMDNETVDFDKPYSDGSMYPGEQDVNCRCVEAFGTGD